MSVQLSKVVVLASWSAHLRWVALVLLLVGEVLALTIRFDSNTLANNSMLWGTLLERVAIVPQLLAVVLTATLIFGGRIISESLSGISLSVLRHDRWPIWLAIHLICFFVFATATQVVFEVDRGSSATLVIFWLFCALVCTSTWVATLVPIADWSKLGRALVGPLLIGALMGIIGWVAGQWSIQYWEVLSSWTFWLVGVLLCVSGVEVFQDVDQFTIGTSLFSVRIAPECSGYEGMGLAAAFLTTYLWWCRSDHQFPRALLLIPISIGLMFLANAVRIALLILLGHVGWQDFALGGFHSQAGWLVFNLVALGLVAFARVSPFFSNRVLATGRTTEFSSVPMLAPFIALTLTIMLTGAIQQGFDWLYPARFLAVCCAVACVAKQLQSDVWKWTWDWAAPSIGIAVFVIWLLLEPNSAQANRTSFDDARAQTPVLFAAWLIFRILGSVVTVPIAEEFAFRGYLLPWLTSSTNDGLKSTKESWVALLLSSAAFGALHPGRWIAGMAAGCLFGLAFYRRRLLMDAVIAHSTTNGLIALLVLGNSQWNLWS